MRWIPVVAGCLVVAGAATVLPARLPSSQPATQPAGADDDAPVTYEEMVAEARSTFARGVTQYRPIDVPVEQVLEATLDRDYIALSPRDAVPADGQAYRLVAPGTDLAWMSVRPDPIDPDAEPIFFNLFRASFGGVDRYGDRRISSLVFLAHRSGTGQLSLSEDIETTRGIWNISLLTYPPGSGDTDVPVRLHVGYNGVDAGVDADGDAEDTPAEENRPVRFTLEAQTLGDLRQQHRETFDTYVKPMLAEVGLEHLLDGEVLQQGVQMFLADLPVEEATREQARTFLETLNSDLYAERLDAADALRAMGRPAVTVLLAEADARELSFEQTQAINELVAPYRAIDAALIDRLRNDPAVLKELAGLSGDVERDAIAGFARARLDELGKDAKEDTASD